MVIEGELEDMGVEAGCNYVKQIVEVEWDQTKISEKLIVQKIEEQGYGCTIG